jgi:uncharacterized damage-inducible protein DinB
MASTLRLVVRPIAKVVAMHTEGMKNSGAEPWLRGPLADVNPLVVPVLYTFQHAREDLAHYTEELNLAQLWATPYDFGSVAFHIRHITGSIDRLMTYLQGKELSDAQMSALQAEERHDGVGRFKLLSDLERTLSEAEAVVRGLDPSTLAEPRTVGRKRLPTTVIGLLTHIAEHTQRHMGQAISAAKLAQATTPPSAA